MMERKFKISIGEYYHVFNRGVDKRIVFNDQKDKDRFIRLLYLCNSRERIKFDFFDGDPISKIKVEKIVSIGAYCLMDNHFHILLKETVEGGISKFMEKLSTGYTMYFNKKNSRTGSLFGGTFKAEHCNRDEYLKYMYSYIHLNPLKLTDPLWKTRGAQDLKKSKKNLSEYKYSSYLDYFDEKYEREESLILDKKEFPEYFQDGEFEKFIDEWIEFKVTPIFQGSTSDNLR